MAGIVGEEGAQPKEALEFEGGLESGRPQKVLMVDDSDILLALAKYLSSRGGYEVLEAASGREALEKFTGDIALALVDNYMPPMDGPQVIEALRRQNAKLPIILMTAEEIWEGNRSLARTLGVRIMDKSNMREIHPLVEQMIGKAQYPRVAKKIARLSEKGVQGGAKALARWRDYSKAIQVVDARDAGAMVLCAADFAVATKPEQAQALVRQEQMLRDAGVILIAGKYRDAKLLAGKLRRIDSSLLSRVYLLDDLIRDDLPSGLLQLLGKQAVEETPLVKWERLEKTPESLLLNIHPMDPSFGRWGMQPFSVEPAVEGDFVLENGNYQGTLVFYKGENIIVLSDVKARVAVRYHDLGLWREILLSLRKEYGGYRVEVWDVSPETIRVWDRMRGLGLVDYVGLPTERKEFSDDTGIQADQNMGAAA